jgi:hypothetical protein
MLECWNCGNTDPTKFKSSAGYPTFRPKCKVCGTIIWKKGEVEHVNQDSQKPLPAETRRVCQ